MTRKILILSLCCIATYSCLGLSKKSERHLKRRAARMGIDIRFQRTSDSILFAKLKFSNYKFRVKIPSSDINCRCDLLMAINSPLIIRIDRVADIGYASSSFTLTIIDNWNQEQEKYNFTDSGIILTTVVNKNPSSINLTKNLLQ